MKQFFLRLLWGVLGVILFVNPVYAEQSEAGQWEVPSLGVMKGVDGFTAIDIEQWAKELEPAVQAINGKKDKNIDNMDLAQLNKIQFPGELKMYQLQVDRGHAYHLAWAIILKEKENGNNKNKITAYFNENQERFLNETNLLLPKGIQALEAESEKTGVVKVKILDVTPFAKLDGSEEVIYTIGGRIIVDSKGLIVPIYAKGFFLNREDRLVSAIILTQDSEGEFWREAADQLFLSITH